MYSKMVTDGFYRVKVWYDEKLKYCPSGSAGVIKFSDGTIGLKSYSTMVIEYNPENGWVICTGTYSATTRKHIGAFCKEFLPGNIGYYTMKEISQKEIALNVKTGETMPLKQALETIAI